MKYINIIITALLFLLVFPSKAQITVDNSMTPLDLVQNVLLGSGVQVMNVSFTGPNVARGTFQGTSNLGMSDGIILATGDISVAVGPNNSDSQTTGPGSAGDNDLNNLIGSTTYDAAVLEFDFIPSSDTVRFFYVFGSEEYQEYVCSSYNDVFAFFLSGPNPFGGNYVNENIAKIPGTSTAVAINSVNNGSVGTFGSVGGCTSLTNTAYFVDNQNPTPGTTIQYDGFTIPLEASALVVPCDTYHIKIAIADVSDGSLDSGVFLKSKSFSSPSVQVSAIGSKADSMMVEGCGKATYTFTRGGDISNPYSIHFIIGGTAINGVDYTDMLGNPIADSVYFPIGVDTALLEIDPIQDGIMEAMETVTLKIPQISSCVTDTVEATIYLENVNPLQVQLSGESPICTDEGEFANLLANYTGGYGPFTFTWSNGMSGDSIIVSPFNTTVYTVSVLDTCGNTSSSSSIEILVACELEIPNVITPNGDGKNDYFQIVNIEDYPGSEVLIYNRWGNKVYESNDYYNNPWKAIDVADGVYYYVIKKTALDKYPAKEYNGSITVLRGK